jgi:hypothetical protein
MPRSEDLPDTAAREYMMLRKARWMMLALGLAASPLATPATCQAPPSPESLLTINNLAHLNAAHAMDAVRTLRPLWLRQRGAPVLLGNQVPVRVYLDGLPLGTLETLETIRLNVVASIQHFGSIEAVQRWGPDHAGGVIHVRTL